MIYLKPLDDAFDRMDVCYARYQDDIVILCKSASQFARAKRRLYRLFKALDLPVAKQKRYLGRLRPFHFLGATLAKTQPCQSHYVPATLHSRSVVKASNKASASIRFESATQSKERYLLLWALWWERALGEDTITHLRTLYEWSKDPLIKQLVRYIISSLLAETLTALPAQ